MKKIKFCDIKNIFETRTAGKLGVDYLGFHLISENDFKRLDLIKICIKELKMFYPNTKSVLVTKENDIETLIKLINSMEFDAVQLHYFNSNEIIDNLKGVYGDSVEIFQVLTSESDKPNKNADNYILDKSFVGGTGKEIGFDKVNTLVKSLNIKNIFLAGGIAAENLYKYIDLDIYGFDIQSNIKAATKTEFENTDANKMSTIAKLLYKESIISNHQVGYAIQDIVQQNIDTLDEAILAKIDFLHIDITDGFVEQSTNLNLTLELIKNIREKSSHINVHYHIFAKSEESYEQMIKFLDIETDISSKIFLHINRDNYDKFESEKLTSEKINYSLDVKDLIDELFPWEKFIKDETLVCLQSKNHTERVSNFNRAHKMINYAHKGPVSITIDRSVDLETIKDIEDVETVNIVSGSFLRSNLSQNYYLLKNYFYVRK